MIIPTNRLSWWWRKRKVAASVLGLLAWMSVLSAGSAKESVTASNSQGGFEPKGARGRERFSSAAGAAWKGATNASRWWWQVEFAEPSVVGAILQVVSDHSFVFQNAPRRYVWQWSEDGVRWMDLPGTTVANEQRLNRIHRMRAAVLTRFLRLEIAEVAGAFPTLREVEVYADPQAAIPFPEWIVAVNVTHDSKPPGHGQEFIPLAKSAAGVSELQAQQVWLDSFDEEFLRMEPRPLCAFLSGSFKDWCEVDRVTWRGVQEVLRNGNLPMWASCGGAQGLAIVAETGVEKPWDCPHCRDPKHPKTPIYTHIGHTAEKPCGDYSACVFERGPHWVRALTDDAVFRHLPREFQVMESHCGQIEWAPKGWSLIATAGPGSKTKTQCIRRDDRPIYAAQFHIEMDGTPAAARQIMSNLLGVAREWGGYKVEHTRR